MWGNHISAQPRSGLIWNVDAMAGAFWKAFTFSDRVERSGDVTRILKWSINQIKVDLWLTPCGWWGERLMYRGQREKLRGGIRLQTTVRDRTTVLASHDLDQSNYSKEKRTARVFGHLLQKYKVNSKILELRKTLNTEWVITTWLLRLWTQTLSVRQHWMLHCSRHKDRRTELCTKIKLSHQELNTASDFKALWS